MPFWSIRWMVGSNHRPCWCQVWSGPDHWALGSYYFLYYYFSCATLLASIDNGSFQSSGFEGPFPAVSCWDTVYNHTYLGSCTSLLICHQLSCSNSRNLTPQRLQQSILFLSFAGFLDYILLSILFKSLGNAL